MLGPDQPHMVSQDAKRWKRAAQDLAISELECKAVYVAGLIRHLVESAGLCLEEHHHLAAYLLTMGAAEALGAVVVANPNRKDDRVAADGLGFLAGRLNGHDRNTEVVKTFHRSYSIQDCINRRHFSAHGGRWTGAGTVLDSELTVELMCRLAKALDRWWKALLRDSAKKQALAVAKIVPLETNGKVVFVHDLLVVLRDGGLPGGELQHEGWRRSC